MDTRIARVGAAAGWLSLAMIFGYHIGLTILAGQRVSGTTDAAAIEAYYRNGIIAPASILTFLAVLTISIFALALREALGGSTRTRFLATLGLVFVVVEMPGIVAQGALEATLVTIASRGGDIVPLFRFWDVLYNSGLYVLEAGWVAAFGIAMTGNPAFPRWLPRFSFAVAVLQLINMTAIWVGIPDQVTLVGNMAFAIWIGAASFGLTRLATTSSRRMVAQVA
ncbi:MAG TPA: hypothetical protein VGQ86_09955 [Candidatus Limnocylindria bacterium]|jgi:hypothetical protein|nr:hypothetical protein [Candidatus Limnocylindria bacterium]